MGKSKLGYWKIRGLAGPIRLLLAYAGEDVEEIYYEVIKKGPNDFDRSPWLDVKHTLGLDFPNLPYYIDGDMKIVQSNAITDYLANKYNLVGETPQEIGILSMVKNECIDLRKGFTNLAYSSPENYDKQKPRYLETLKLKLDLISKFLGTKSWVAGEKVSYVDFELYDLLDTLKRFDATAFDGKPNLQAYLDRFEALPVIKEYMSSDKYLAWPLNNKMATFGGSTE